MVPLYVRCSRCGGNLMDPDHRVDGQPGICLGLESDGCRGMIWLSCLYGSYAVDASVPMTDGEIVALRCPACGEDLTSAHVCDKCGAPMAPLRIDTGGIVEICRRKGCRNHYLEFADEKDLARFYDALGTFLRPPP